MSGGKQSSFTSEFVDSQLSPPDVESSKKDETQAIELQEVVKEKPSTIHQSHLTQSQFGNMVRQSIKNRLPSLNSEESMHELDNTKEEP